MVVAVTGASGQVGQALKFIAPHHPELTFCFASSSEVDITDKSSIIKFFSQYNPQVCINAAAYTAVDKAESEPDKAFAVNVTGAKNVAEVCKQFGALMVHISTDFVFDGSKNEPYLEDDLPNPKSVYGESKLGGEKEIQAVFDKYYIVRTSWVYSPFGNNFMKTMLRLAAERDNLSVVNDQTGTPTNAVDLAEALAAIIKSDKKEYGIYNYSNEGSCSWYEFARKIFEINKINIDLQPIPTSSYPTPAKRPAYSVMAKDKIKKVFNIAIKDWQQSIPHE